MSIEQNFMTPQEKEALLQAARLLGQKGGPAAAKARFAKMTSEQRSEYGRRLAAARWNKRIVQENPRLSPDAGE